MENYQFGMIGLGTMGQNFALNIADHGYSIAGYDKDLQKINELNSQRGGRKLEAFPKIEEFLASLAKPRNIILLVPAGPIVDAVLSELQPLLTKDDLVIDCGNSHFIDTNKRIEELQKADIHFIGAGISGGESGARYGPSIMPGGDTAVYERLGSMLEAVAAKANGKPCVAYMGNGAAGHYVKMVHNGIEYALMQLLAESYQLLKQYAGLSNAEIAEVYSSWNKGKLQSFLVEITAAIFRQKDDKTQAMLIDMISDTAHQKGTGAWMSEDAMKIQSPIPAIDAAVSQRTLSAMKTERVAASQHFQGATQTITTNKKDFISQLEDALHAGFILAYAQGLAMLQTASTKYKFNINIATVASIWRGGCIIRAAMLDDITNAFVSDPELKNLMLSKSFAGILQKEIYSIKAIVKTGVNAGIPLPSLYTCLSYFESYHSAWLPANLVQAQRDFFGAHTYERLDEPGFFHYNWNEIVN